MSTAIMVRDIDLNWPHNEHHLLNYFLIDLMKEKSCNEVAFFKLNHVWLFSITWDKFSLLKKSTHPNELIAEGKLKVIGEQCVFSLKWILSIQQADKRSQAWWWWGGENFNVYLFCMQNTKKNIFSSHSFTHSLVCSLCFHFVNDPRLCAGLIKTHMKT